MARDKTRTLIVDDGDEIRALYRNLLALTNDFVVAGTATNGYEAIDMAKVVQPDLVLLDVLMPDLDGIKAFPQIRLVAPAAKVVFLTVMYGWDDEDVAAVTHADLRELGADDVISKALSPSKVLARLRKVMTGE